MHIDENKKYDKRNVERNIKSGVISQKDYEIYLSKLPDNSDNIFNPEESFDETIEHESFLENESQSNKAKGTKKKALKGK